MSSFHCTLTLEGQFFPVAHCEYAFNQATSERGRVAGKVRAGTITLQLDVPDSDAILAWATDPHKKMSGVLLFNEANRPIAREILTFDDAFCVSYEEIFIAASTTAGAYRCMLQISAARLTLGAAVKDSAWMETR